MDGDRLEDRAPSGREPRNPGYGARGVVGIDDRRRARRVVALIVATIGFSALVAAVTNPGTVVSPSFADTSPSPSLTDSLASGPVPTSLPRLGFFGSPLPMRPVPFAAARLQWMDPVTGLIGGQADPADLGVDRTFVDAKGRAISLCFTNQDEGTVRRTTVRLCAYDDHGLAMPDAPVITEFLSPNALDPDYDLSGRRAIEFDATVSRDGRWLWMVSAFHAPGHWEVTATRVDVATRRADGHRVLRDIPVEGLNSGAPASAGPSSSAPASAGWVVGPDSTILPVVRATPDGLRLSVTLTAVPAVRSESAVPAVPPEPVVSPEPAVPPEPVVSPEPGVSPEPAFFFGRERIVLDATLDPDVPIDVAFPFGGASDQACDAQYGAWATDEHYLTICSHRESSGEIQAFVRIENPGDLTRDVAFGPATGLTDGRVTPESGGSAWLLDGTRGALYRWVPASRTLSMLDIATRAGTTVLIDRRPVTTGAVWPAQAPPSDKSAWSPVTTSPDATSDGRLIGRQDGRVVYLLSPGAPVRGSSSEGPASIWAVDALTLALLARWDAPAPADQMVLAPGDETLVMLATPRALPVAPVGPGPVADWVAAAWFVDARIGAPLEVLGQIHGPGFSTMTLLQPSVASFAGF